MSIQATKIINRADVALQSLVDGDNLACEWFGWYKKHNARFDSVACAALIVDSIANALQDFFSGNAEDFADVKETVNAYIEANLASWNLKEFKSMTSITLKGSMDKLSQYAELLILRVAAEREHIDGMKGAVVLSDYAQTHKTSVVSIEAVTAYTRVAVFANGHYCTMHDQTELDAISYSFYTFKNKLVKREYSFTVDVVDGRKLLDHELPLVYSSYADMGAYFVYGGKRWYMSEVMTAGLGSDYDGTIGLTNTSAYGVKLLDGGEYVALYLLS